MKLLSSILLSGSLASHFRGGTYQVIPEPENGRARIEFTHAWRTGNSGYAGGCEQSDITNSIKSTVVKTASCTPSCGNHGLQYQVTFVGDQFEDVNDQYCYGDGVNYVAESDQVAGQTYGWSSQAWVSLTTDSGSSQGGGNMEQHMKINDWSNTSPTYKLPPIWMIMAGCDNQFIDLAPHDVDGDKFQCRWGTSAEAGGAFNNGNWPSLSLDTENCIVTYTGSMDQSTSGVKPIGLMIEDFDSNGNVRSSIPIQFLAMVWTPNLARGRVGQSANPYPNWFGDDDDDDRKRRSAVAMVRSRRSTEPAYCGLTPIFNDNIGQEILMGANGDPNLMTFSLSATPQVGTISHISYQAPIGLTCTGVGQDGADPNSVDCSWRPTLEQKTVEKYSFCFSFTDSIGLTTTRTCKDLIVKEVFHIVPDQDVADVQPLDEMFSKDADGCRDACDNFAGCNAFTYVPFTLTSDHDHGFIQYSSEYYHHMDLNNYDTFAEDAYPEIFKNNCFLKTVVPGYQMTPRVGAEFHCANSAWDECLHGDDNCDPDHGICTDTVGSFTCACPVGSIDDNGDGTKCTPTDECALGLDNCHADAICTDTPLSFECTCKPGYRGDGVNCVDIDECAEGSDNCSRHAHCTNTIGSFFCDCWDGWTDAQEGSGGWETSNKDDIGRTCTCESEASNIICNDVSMGLQLGKCHIDTGSPYDVDHFLNNARVGDGGLVPPAFTTFDPECLGEDDGDYLTFYMNSTTCGTGMNESDHWYTFYNHVTQIGDYGSNAVIARSFETQYDFVCRIRKDMEANMKPLHPLIASSAHDMGSKSASFELTMGAYDPGYNNLLDSSHKFRIPEMLNIRAKTKIDTDNYRLKVKECWATARADPAHALRYGFLNNFCPITSVMTDGALDVQGNGRSNHFDFQLRSFQFINDPECIYLHCRAVLCETNLKSSCEPVCTANNPFRKRRSESDFTPGNHQQIVLGPFNFVQEN